MKNTLNMTGHINLDDLFSLHENCHVYIVDKQGKLLKTNPLLINFLVNNYGYTGSRDIVGKNVADIFFPVELKVILEENNLVMNSGKTHQFINFVYSKDHKTVVFFTMKTPYYNEKNEIIGVFGISSYLSLYEPSLNSLTPLSDREIDCLKLLIQGHTSKTISKELEISKRTVETYIENIKNKLSCDSKSEIIDRVFKLGLDTITAGDSHTKSVPFNPGVFFGEADAKDKK
jgi:DNA-binding CsgD family transcriptional regulator